MCILRESDRLLLAPSTFTRCVPRSRRGAYLSRTFFHALGLTFLPRCTIMMLRIGVWRRWKRAAFGTPRS